MNKINIQNMAILIELTACSSEGIGYSHSVRCLCPYRAPIVKNQELRLKMADLLFTSWHCTVESCSAGFRP